LKELDRTLGAGAHEGAVRNVPNNSNTMSMFVCCQMITYKRLDRAKFRAVRRRGAGQDEEKGLNREQGGGARRGTERARKVKRRFILRREALASGAGQSLADQGLDDACLLMLSSWRAFQFFEHGSGEINIHTMEWFHHRRIRELVKKRETSCLVRMAGDGFGRCSFF